MDDTFRAARPYSLFFMMFYQIHARLSSSLLLILLVEVAVTFALSQADLRHRSIYQLLTDRFARSDGRYDAPCDPAERIYCGGNWKGVEAMLPYIQDMGFDTVWISPVVANIEEKTPYGHAYHGYWASDIGELNPHFGTKEDLKNLSDTLHARGMYLMVDVVANHVGAESLSTFAPGSHYGPFSSDEDFHDFCIPKNWDNPIEAEQCWLSQQMPDLNTESPRVVRHLHAWIRDLVKTFDIDAIRIDTVKHVRKDFWPDFVRSAGVAAMGEVLHGDPAFLAPYQAESISSLLDYGAYFALRRVFDSPTSDVHDLHDMIERLRRTMPDTTALGSFLDNHDYPRFAGLVEDPVLVKNAAVYPFINDGFPIIYMGQEHGLRGGDDPFNREAIWLHGYYADLPLLGLFRSLNAARRKVIAAHPPYLHVPMRSYRLNSHAIALVKPPYLSVLSNYGSAATATVLHIEPSQSPFKPLLPIIDILTEQIFASDPRGGVTVPIIAGEPRVFLPLSIWRDEGAVSKSAWAAPPPMKIDTKSGTGSKGGTGGPMSPGNLMRSPSFGMLMSWFGSPRGGKSSDL